MRLTETLSRVNRSRYLLPHGGYCANHRRMTELEFPYAPIRDLKLKNKVSGKYDREAEANCMTEMASLMACMKANNFLEPPCLNEIKTLSECQNRTEGINKQKKLEKKRGEMNYGSKHLNHRQLNELMKKFPQKVDGKPSRS